jgi:hypothetical protein
MGTLPWRHQYGVSDGWSGQFLVFGAVVVRCLECLVGYYVQLCVLVALVWANNVSSHMDLLVGSAC